MKIILTLAALFAVIAHSSANAASIYDTRTGLLTYSLFLDGGSDNGGFDMVSVVIKPTGPQTFTNQSSGLVAGIPLPPGQPFSYINRKLDLDRSDPNTPGGVGWTIQSPVNTATELSFTGGPVGQKITTANQPFGRLFLANVNVQKFSCQAIATVRFFDQGGGYFRLSPCVIAEPGTWGISRTRHLCPGVPGRIGRGEVIPLSPR